MYLAADTGVTNGIAHFDDEGVLIYFDQLTIEEFIAHLEELRDKVKAIIYEEYIVDPRYVKNGRLSTAGSKNEASKVIGMIEMFCKLNKIPYYTVQRHEKAAGYAWASLKTTKNHNDSHWRDAVAVGTVWLVKNGVIKKGTLPIDAY